MVHMPNRLANETSPYLLQHAGNPVDWRPWGEEAFAAARARDVPVFLSVGYSTCHWCHVMAHESFEDPGIARLLNERFVPVKVDREERPDVDAVHMAAAQAMGVHGGWPLSVFLAPDGRPFYAGTYWPPVEGGPMPSFRRVLTAIARAWEHDRAPLLDDAARVTAFLRETEEAVVASGPTAEPAGGRTAELAGAVDRLAAAFDPRWGGFGTAPKFPMPPVLVFLLRHHARTGDPRALAMAETTLAAMAGGGIHDHLGGGFARYSTDAQWHVPHFEKMLYDNAQLLELYADLALVTGRARYREVAAGIVRWLEREMLTDGGAFAAALDADSEEVEGLFHLWTTADVGALLGDDDAALVAEHFGIRDPGPFEGANVLRIAVGAEELAAAHGEDVADVTARLAAAAARLFAAREQRVHPARDDKVIAAWNGLTIHALAHAGRALDQPRWVALAEAAARFVLAHLRGADGGLARTWNRGRTSGVGTLEDHAAMARGLLTLYAATGERDWLVAADELVEHARREFRHESGMGFHDALDTGLFVRSRSLADGVLPSGNALMAEVLALLGTLRYDDAPREEAERIVAAASRDHPLSAGFLLAVAERLAVPARELVIAGEPWSPAAAALRDVALRRFEPALVVGWAGSVTEVAAGGRDGVGRFAMLADRPAVDGAAAAAYLCEDFACRPPVTTPGELAALLDGGDAESDATDAP